jgi:hypothetical protein
MPSKNKIIDQNSKKKIAIFDLPFEKIWALKLAKSD